MFQITPGTIIDERYRVISRLGSGGMADVYCAEDAQLGRRVAVKLLHERFAQDAEFVERFRREASSAASLSHANIVAVYDRGEWGGTYYIAMELLEGRSLDAIVREEAPLTPERAIEITEQVLRAARFAHKRGVVHRDLKPHNVIVDDEARVKVTDFGIARAGASEITQTGSIMGTARYLSPEQAQGEAIGPSSDLYAIGILLYELLTGTVPFEGDSVVAIALRHLSEPPRPPSTLVSSISPNLDAIVLRALAKTPEQRFADADDFLAALAGERERLRAEDGSKTASFTPMLLPAPLPAPVSAASAQAAQTLLPAAYAGVGAEPAYWDSTATSIVTPGNGGPPRRGAPAWPWALLGAVLAAGVIVALVLLLIPARRTVPGVVGETQVAASETLAADGFTVVPTYETSRVGANRVITQSPGPGSELQKGATVGIVVSSGPGAKTVPDVTGEPVAAAKQQLRAEHFNYTASSQATTGVKKGYVVSTNPIAGSTASPGSVIQLTVSSGPPLQNLAQVTGLQYVNAQSALISQGFKVKKVPVSSSLTPGQVISQTPAGAKAPEGSTVTLDVARAPTTIEVPNVQGLTEASADSTLVSEGFSPTNTTQPVLNPAQNGIVLTQSPAAGSRVKKGTAIVLTVASYTAPSTGTSGTSGTSGTTGTS